MYKIKGRIPKHLLSYYANKGVSPIQGWGFGKGGLFYKLPTGGLFYKLPRIKGKGELTVETHERNGEYRQIPVYNNDDDKRITEKDLDDLLYGDNGINHLNKLLSNVDNMDDEDRDILLDYIKKKQLEEQEQTEGTTPDEINEEDKQFKDIVNEEDKQLLQNFEDIDPDEPYSEDEDHKEIVKDVLSDIKNNFKEIYSDEEWVNKIDKFNNVTELNNFLFSKKIPTSDLDIIKKGFDIELGNRIEKLSEDKLNTRFISPKYTVLNSKNTNNELFSPEFKTILSKNPTVELEKDGVKTPRPLLEVFPYDFISYSKSSTGKIVNARLSEQKAKNKDIDDTRLGMESNLYSKFGEGTVSFKPVFNTDGYVVNIIYKGPKGRQINVFRNDTPPMDLDVYYALKNGVLRYSPRESGDLKVENGVGKMPENHKIYPAKLKRYIRQ